VPLKGLVFSFGHYRPSQSYAALSAALSVGNRQRIINGENSLAAPESCGRVEAVPLLSAVDQLKVCDVGCHADEATWCHVRGSPPSMCRVWPVRNVFVIAKSTPSAMSMVVPIRRAGLRALIPAK
jgi:hypothetical protein